MAKKQPTVLQQRITDAHRKVQAKRSDVMAFAERNREIVEIPEGLRSGNAKRRLRGNREDRDCIEEICELLAQGITLTAATRFVGVPWMTWHGWVKRNHKGAGDCYREVYPMHLDAMADQTLMVFEEMKEQRKKALAEYHAAHDEWREWSKQSEDDRRPPEPLYKGPSELDVSMADKECRVWQWQLERLHAKFRSKHENYINNTTSVVHEINVHDATTPEEAMAVYKRMLHAKPV
jgi:hypothetical protein